MAELPRDSVVWDAEPEQNVFQRFGSFFRSRSTNTTAESQTYDSLLEQSKTEKFVEEDKSGFIYVGGVAFHEKK